jgi:Flp pilus assembly pilin Flp
MRRLVGDESGVTIVEFALIAPVLLLSIMGIFDIGYNVYTQGLLRGAIQKAARDSTIQGAEDATDLIDARVTRVVHQIVPSAVLDFDRASYTSFADVSQPEDFTDIDADGDCNHGEPFEDANANGTWDSDRGADGLGGARDVVLYNVEVRYERAFPLAGMIGLSPTVTTNATTVLRNQPYAAQDIIAIAGNCA